MMINFMLLLVGGVSVMALYIMMAFLATLSMENDLPDLEDIQIS